MKYPLNSVIITDGNVYRITGVDYGADYKMGQPCDPTYTVMWFTPHEWRPLYYFESELNVMAKEHGIYLHKSFLTSSKA